MGACRFHQPQRGDKKALIDFSLKNLRFFMLDRQKAQDKIDPNRHANRVLKTLKEDLRLSALPVHIECFDNSNFHGSFPVAACVVFKDAKPSKQDYRHFNIKTVEGPDDFASMEGSDLPPLQTFDGREPIASPIDRGRRRKGVN